MPDEQSNLNLPPAARRPTNRRRGRRGGRGRGRGPRPADESAQPPVPGDPSHPTEAATEDADAPEGQPEVPQSSDVSPAASAPENTPVSPAVESSAPPARPHSAPPPRHERRPEPPPAKPWVKPADFRAADASAIHQAVVHATEIAEGLRELVDRIDEILELVEVAERQKLADERELDNLRRALRRIQPPRQNPPHEPHRGHSRGDNRPRHDSPPPRQEHSPAQEPSTDFRSEAEEAPEREFHGESPSEGHDEGPGESHSGESNPET